MRAIRKAVIPAAGMGTRFLPATKAVPKEMLPIVDKPTIQYVVEEAVASGLRDVIFVTSQGKDAIEDHFDHDFKLERMLRERGKTDLLRLVDELSHMISVATIRQKVPQGLGHAILATASLVGEEPFGVFLADDIILGPRPCMQQLLEVHARCGGCVLAVREVAAETVSRFGIVKTEPLSGQAGVLRVTDLVEKPSAGQAPSRLAIMGRYVLMPTIFEALEHTRPGADGEIQLTDAIRQLLPRESVLACPFEGVRYDAGNKLEFLKATVDFGLRHPEVGEEFRAYLEELKL